MRALHRLLNLWRGTSLDRDFDDEIADHFNRRIEAGMRAGMTAAEAAQDARRHFGSVLRAREGMREARVAEWIPAFGRDVRVAGRTVMRQPALAALAVLTLSLGVGAIGAVFSLIHGMQIRPLPYLDADRVAAIVDTFQSGPPRTAPTIPELLDLRAAATTFDSLSFVDWRDFQMGGGTEPARVVGARSETSLLRVLGVAPALGRLFSSQDAEPGHPVAILTDGLWRRNFGADPAIIGRSIVLNGQMTEVVGVLPPAFRFDFFSADPVDVYVPFPMLPVYTSRTAEFVNVRRVVVVGRLKPGIAMAQADAEVRTIGTRIAASHPELYRQGTDRRDVGFAMMAERLQDHLFGGSRTTAGLVSAAAVLLLLIACVNMGQFLLAHALERRPELAMRSALGAARGHLARQLVAEALVLATVAAASGLVLAAVFIRLLRFMTESQDPFVASRIELSAPVAAFTVAMAVVVTLLCNLVPMVRLARSSPLHVFATREAAPRTGVRHALIAVQVAVTVTFLAMTVLLVHSITRLDSGDRGYTAEGVTAIRLRAPLRVPPTGVGPLYRQYLERLRAIPEVSAVAMADAPLPLFASTTFWVDGAEADAATLSTQQAGYRIVSPDYFSTIGIPLRAGRTFTDGDQTGQPPVAVVNEEMARRAWPGQHALGRRLRAGQGPRAAIVTIIGVVGNVRPAMQLEPIPQVYVSYLQQTEPNMTVLARSRAGQALPVAAIKQAVWSVAADQPLFDIRPLPDLLSNITAEPRRSMAVLLGSIATMAVVISGVGMFTLVTYVTAKRRREIALRRVIGAGVTDVVRLVSGPTVRWTCAGLLGGLAAAIAGAGVLRANFTGVAPTDPALLALVGVFYVALAAMAVCAPALSALRSDPATILRSE